MARSSSGGSHAVFLEGGGMAQSDGLVTPFIGGSHKTKAFPRRSGAIAYGTPYQKAAALVDLAEDGSGLPEEILHLPSIETAARYYFIFIRFDIIWTLNIFALIALNFFEKPLWCSSVSEVTCSDRDYYFLGELPYLNNAESLAFESVTLIILAVHTLFPILYEGFGLYWKSHVNKIKAKIREVSF
ncbi:ion transport domain-containing protein [Artemisia annua]|uniref:Ion transport domain-containing protein n=1 Tax=Artemisia annua TaxID=35608 RepID=A0A2U1KJ77_ARTAN|nr:ion transport domain-containing protein [Artemisia annua]